MKKYLAGIFSIIMFATSCSNEVEKKEEDTNTNPETDKKEIIKVIESETDAFINLDYEKWSSLWVQDENSTYITAAKDNYVYANGFDEIDIWIKELLNNSKEKVFSRMEKKNYKITHHGKIASAVYDEIWYGNDDQVLDNVLITKGFKKVDGKWKIIYTSSIRKSSYKSQE